MKLFQIEEPEGGPTDPDLPGMAIGIDLGGAIALVAVSVGGNPVVLADREGFEQDLAVPAPEAGLDHWEELLVGARLRAERALARPATHAVIVVASAADSATAECLSEAAGRAGLGVLRLVAAADLQPGAAPVLAAALLAEDLAPRPEPGAVPGANLT
ncbi:MAG: hypothetical protein ACREE9_18160 [Stellaceae bacterium]